MTELRECRNNIMMVSMIEYDANNRELCDGGPRFDATTIALHCQPTTTNDDATDDALTAVVSVGVASSNAADADANIDGALAKRTLKLELSPKGVEKGSLDNEDDEKAAAPELLSPTVSNSSKYGSKPSGTAVAHPNTKAVVVHAEVVDDRKALRDALYQGIFHRHRRTIFAMGSFIRMLKSRSSQYNTIRSASDGEEEPR